MQTTKFLFVIGLVATLVAFALTSGARDTEAQIKAREALRQKMSELDTPSATVPPPAAPAPPPAPAAPAKPAPPTVPAAPPQAVAPVVAPQKALVVPTAPVPAPAMAFPGSSKFAPVPEAGDAANTARATAALRQDIAVLEGTVFAPVPDAVEDANAAQARAALRQEMALLDDSEFAPVPDVVEDANAAQARAALWQEMALLESSPATAIRPTKSGYRAAYIAPLVMEVPLSPLSGPKAARLAELLKRYDANQITPKDYHVQRAAIIAEP